MNEIAEKISDDMSKRIEASEQHQNKFAQNLMDTLTAQAENIKTTVLDR
jgi:hypothetical protein